MPRRALLILLSLSLVWGSCAHRAKPPQTSDLRADAKLGASSTNETEEAQRSLQEIQEKQLQEQKRQLERQITDPLAE